MPDDQQPPWRALQRLERATLAQEGIAVRAVRSNAMLENFRAIYGGSPQAIREATQRANYGWHNSPTPEIVRPPGLSHNVAHVDRSEPPLTPRRVTFPMFEIASNPTINLSEIRNRRFDLIDGERHRPAKVPAVERLLEGLIATFTQPRYKPPPPRPELPRRSRWEVLAA